MNTRTGLTALFGATVIALSSFPVSALQDPAAPTKASPPLVIKVGVDLIQLDAVVTDKNGQPVRDLRPEDFTLEVDGKVQPVTNAMFFEGTAGSGVGTSADPSRTAGASSPDRTVVFMVDDLNTSFESMYKARRAIRLFAADWDFKEARVGLTTTSDDGGRSSCPTRRDGSIRHFRRFDTTSEAAKGVRARPSRWSKVSESGPGPRRGTRWHGRPFPPSTSTRTGRETRRWSAPTSSSGSTPCSPRSTLCDRCRDEKRWCW